MKCKIGESLTKLSGIFARLHHKIVTTVKPYQIADLVVYASSFESDFSLHLRERKLTDLDSMFSDIEYLESNMRALGLLPGNKPILEDKRRFKVDGASSFNPYVPKNPYIKELMKLMSLHDQFDAIEIVRVQASIFGVHP